MADPVAGQTVVVLGSYAPSLIFFRGPMIEDLVGRGHRVVAMAHAIDPATRERLAAIGAEARDVSLVNNSLNPLSMAKSVGALAGAFREIRPGTVIAYTVKPVTLGAIAAARVGVPAFVPLVTGLGFAFTEGGGLKRRLSRLVASQLYRRAFRLSRSIVFQNPDDRDEFRRLGLVPEGAKVTVVNGSGIDLERFRPAPLTAEPRFLMISRLLGDKGVREYGRAAARLKARYPSASFQLVGYFDRSPDSIGEEELEEYRRGGVEFVGKLDDVRPAIAETNIYVLPSYREGTPRSVLEAMAMGRPVVTTDAPGCRETVEEGVSGFLVPPRDADSLERAMERFIERPELIREMGANGRALAERKYDVRAVNRAIVEAAGL
jgi:glycosyltransferase involved in cell wall biosynthesis